MTCTYRNNKSHINIDSAAILFSDEQYEQRNTRKMPQRQQIIARSVTYSVLHSDRPPSFLAKLPAFFYLYWLTFECLREDLFTALRGVWEIDLKDYRKSFGAEDRKKDALQPMGQPPCVSTKPCRLLMRHIGDMGYSGSTFFSTAVSACDY